MNNAINNLQIHRDRIKTQLQQKLTDNAVKQQVLQFKPEFSYLSSQKLIAQPQNRVLIVWRDDKVKIQQILLTRDIFDCHQKQQITKIKYLRKSQSSSNNGKGRNVNMLKVIAKDKVFLYGASTNIIQEYFMKIILIKFAIQNIPKNMKFQGKVQGTLLKKSDYFWSWEKVQVIISSQQGLKWRDGKKQFQEKYIKEIWTWFNLQNKIYLIIKLKKNSVKRQFAIPLHELRKWLPAFMMLLDLSKDLK